MNEYTDPPACPVCGRATALHERNLGNRLVLWFQCRPWWRFWGPHAVGEPAAIDAGWRDWGIRAARIKFLGGPRNDDELLKRLLEGRGGDDVS